MRLDVLLIYQKLSLFKEKNQTEPEHHIALAVSELNVGHEVALRDPEIIG